MIIFNLKKTKKITTVTYNGGDLSSLIDVLANSDTFGYDDSPTYDLHLDITISNKKGLLRYINKFLKKECKFLEIEVEDVCPNGNKIYIELSAHKTVSGHTELLDYSNLEEYLAIGLNIVQI